MSALEVSRVSNGVTVPGQVMKMRNKSVCLLPSPARPNAPKGAKQNYKTCSEMHHLPLYSSLFQGFGVLDWTMVGRGGSFPLQTPLCWEVISHLDVLFLKVLKKKKGNL